MKKIFTLLPFIALLLGCQPNDDVPFVDEYPVDEMMEDTLPEKINFRHLEVGQKSRYLLFKGGTDSSYFDFKYLPDTLVVEIVDTIGNSFKINEYFTPGSSVFFGGASAAYFDYPDSVYAYFLTIKDGILHVETLEPNDLPANRLFLFASLDLELTYSGENINSMIGWLPSTWLGGGNRMASLLSYNQLDTTYFYLNLYLQNEWVSFDGPGYSYIYSNISGLVRTAFGYNFWNSSDSSFGWALLPD